MFKFFRPAYTLMWYVLREFFVSFVLAVMATTLFMMLVYAYAMAADLDSFGVNVAQVLMMFPFLLPRALTFALPPATMIATIMVFGRLNAENEILAAQAGGAALRRFVWPLIFCSGLIALGSLWLHDDGLRWGNDTIRTHVLKLNKPEFFKNLDKPGSSFSIRPDPNKYTRINLLPAETEKDGSETRPIQIVNFANSKVTATVFAKGHQFLIDEDPSKKASDRKLTMKLKEMQEFGDNYNSATESEFTVQLPDIGALIPIGNTRGQKSWRENMDDARKIARDEHRRWKFMLRRASDFGALAAAGSPLDPATPGMVINTWNENKLHIDYIVAQGGAVDRGKQDTIEYHLKIALSILPISMIFLGVGLGLLVKKSNRMIGFLLGLFLYFLVYYPLTVVAKLLSSSGNWDKIAKICPPQYFPNILVLIFGYVLWRMHEHGFNMGFFNIFSSSSETAPVDPSDDPRGYSAAEMAYEGGGSQAIERPALEKPRHLAFLHVISDVLGFLWRVPAAIFRFIVRLPVCIFRRTTDKYIGMTFLTPLFVVIICFAGLLTAFDAIEHMPDILDGIRHSNEPLGALPIRTQPEAVRDVVVYYGIQALDCTLDYWALEVLVAGLLCAMVLVRNQEHLILKSSGIKLQRALRPMIVFAIVAGGCVALVREMWMPELIVRRDFLKPQIYHRNSQPTSLALYAIGEKVDAKGELKPSPQLFELGSYNSATKEGRDLHVYMLGKQKNKHIPLYTADVAKWNTGWAWDASKTHQEFNSKNVGWKLYTDPNVQAMKQLEQSSGMFGGSKDKDKEKDRDPKKKSVKGVPVETSSSTATAADFTLPNSSDAVTVELVNSAWMAKGDVVFVTGGGYFSVLDVPNGATAVLANLNAPSPNAGKKLLKGAVVERPAYTPTDSAFAQPAPGTAIVLNAVYSGWMTPDQNVRIAGSGYYKVVSTTNPVLCVGGFGMATAGRNKASASHPNTYVKLVNTESFDNAAIGTQIPAGARLEKPSEYPGGLLRENNSVDDDGAGGENLATLKANANDLTHVLLFQGPIDPKYIDGERLGAKVMRLNELKKLSALKSELLADWYRRIAEFAMGFILLWCALPMMLRDSSGSTVTAITVSIVLAALYMGLNVAAAKLGAEGAVISNAYFTFRVPPWAPLIPHGFFFVVGLIQYYWRMET